MADPLAGPRLIVPTDVTALVVTGDAGNATWADVAAGYDQLDLVNYLGGYILPAPLTTRAAPEPGVHLHWALPDALTHGLQGSEGMTFPLVPNRWLVTRSWWGGKHTLSKGWVVQSDALSESEGAQCVAWPVYDAGADPPYDSQYLGAVMDAVDWEGETQPVVKPFLTAVGPGDPTFAACYWNCRGVFTLWDDASDLAVADTPIALTYSVVGWYSDPSKSPLAGYTDAQAWATRMQDLGWVVPEGTSAMPIDVLVHGLLHSVQWAGPGAAFQSGVPAGQVDVTFGNTTAEALAALLRSELQADQDVEAVLEAFQYGVLATYEGQGGALELGQALHERQFGSSPGGAIWDIRRKPGAPAASGPATALPDDVAIALAALNDAQAQVDAASRGLESARRKLYLVWYRKVEIDIAENGPEPPGPPFTEMADWITTNLWPLVDERQRALADLETQLESNRAAVTALLVGDLADYELVELAAPRFWQANNPVALLSGPGVLRSYRHGEDDRFGGLLCRVPGQTVTAITVYSEVVDATALAPFAGTPPPIGGPVPAEWTALALETALLAPSLAAALAWSALALSGISDPSNGQVAEWTSAAQAVQNGAWNAVGYDAVDGQSLAAAAGITGTVPSKIAVSQWGQPWIPLSFQWSARWIPSSVDRTVPLDHWALDGADYVWDGSDPDANSLDALGVPGAAPINPAAAVGLATAIDKYLTDHPDDPHAQALKDIAAGTAQLNVVAQALSGFNGTLYGTKETLQFPVIDVTTPDLGAGVAQRVGDANGLSPADSPQADSTAQTFFPIRAGHLLFYELRVVDAFGQSQQVVAQNADPDLICSTPMTTQGAPTLAQLPPRIAQPSRLAFRYIAADPPQRSALNGGLVEANRGPAMTPIAAWLLPNRLDASLMVYDAAGDAQGELQMIDGSIDPTGHGVRWVPAPGLPVTYGAGPDLAPHAQQFAAAMISLSTGGPSALSQLLPAIDEALWTVDPLGSWNNQSLAQLVGRPLALVRATIALELDGDPVFDTTWGAMQNALNGNGFDDFGLTDASFNVTLGNSEVLTDGLIGYFFDDDYSRFSLAEYGQTPPPGGYVVAAQPIGLKPSAPPITITMIVDPRAAVHATSGILPTKSISLPPDQVQAALSTIVITFMAGPLVTDSQVLAAPTPGGPSRDWSWLEHPAPPVWQTVPQVAAPTATAELTAAPQRIVDGWLKRGGAFTTDGGRRSIRGV